MSLRWFELNNWSIRNKLILHFALIGIVSAIALGILVAWAVSGTIEHQVNNTTTQLIGNVNKSLDSHASSIQNISYFVSFNPGVMRFLEQGRAALAGEAEQYEMKRFLQGFTTLYPEIAGLMVVNARGEYVSNEMYARTSRSLTEENWYREAVENRGIFKMIGHPLERNVRTHSNYRDDEVVSVVRAILDPDTQRTLGVVLIDLKLRVIAETVHDVRLGKTGFLMVIDDKGDTIYAPNNAVAGHFDRTGVAGKDSGMFTERIEGTRMQVIFQKSPFTNWTTVGIFPMRESVQEIRIINGYLVSFVFLVCLLGVAAAYYLSRSISRPIVQLASFMRKVEEGNMNIRYASPRADEVGVLGRSFNTMLARITRLLGQVEEEQRLKREAELRSLQAHIQPHFLYNTLDTIQWLARRDGAYESADVVESLARLFRIGLSKGKEIVPLRDEIEHIRSYLNIQQTRYKDKLRFSIEAEGDVLELPVLKIILQPVVENAIYHGIKERRGPGLIRIRAHAAGGMLQLTVEDDGVGLSAERLQALRAVLAHAATKKSRGLQTAEAEETAVGAEMKEAGEAGAVRSDGWPPEVASSAVSGAIRRSAAGLAGGSLSGMRGGYGLKNVQERIRLSFGENYGITVESEERRGTRVTIRHPVIVKEALGQ